jgi:glycosyltransferase involved in cell wall biosynthesis
MRIAIDYTAAVRQSAGIGRYTRGLVHGLAQIDPVNRYSLLCAGSRRDLTGIPERFEVRWLPISERALTFLWHRLAIPVPAEWLAGHFDIYHSPDYVLPPLRRASGIVTIHDVSFMRVPECADPRLRSYLMSAVPRSISRARLILADSQCTSHDLQALMGVSERRICVVPAGVDAHFTPLRDAAAAESVRRRYSLPDRYVLAVSTIEPRKNFARLISAFAEARRRHGIRQDLVICGARGWMYEEVFERVRQEGAADYIHFAGFAQDGDLPAIYGLADLFVYPSLYEGFGLPPLEAMACGVPVVASDNSSLPETLGSAAFLVDATDDSALTDAIAKVLLDEELRVALRARGFQRASMFTWNHAASLLLSAYHQVALETWP